MNVGVSLYLLHVEFQNTHSTIKVRTFLQCGALLAGPHNFKGVKNVLFRL